MHLAANRAVLDHLKKGGLLNGNVEDMIAVSLIAPFDQDSQDFRYFMI